MCLSGVAYEAKLTYHVSLCCVSSFCSDCIISSNNRKQHKSLRQQIHLIFTLINVMSESRVFSQESLLEHVSANGGRCFITVHENVYDVTEFIDEHPGGEETLRDVQIKTTFKDATEAFEDTGHSMDARDLMVKYQVGTIQSDAGTATAEGQEATSSNLVSESNGKKCCYWLPLAVGVVAVAVGFYFYKRK